VQILKSSLPAYGASRPIRDRQQGPILLFDLGHPSAPTLRRARRRAQVAVKTGCTSRRRLGLDGHEHGGRMGNVGAIRALPASSLCCTLVADARNI